MTTQWETIYAAGRQLNAYPYTEAVSFIMRGWSGGFPDGFHALDVGCGSGVHAALLAGHGAKVTAFDFSPSAVAAARDRYPDPNISFVTSDIQGFDAGETKFSLIFDRLSSTHSSRRAVRDLYQKLRPSLTPGAKVFWQGFDMGNSGRAFGTYDAEAECWIAFTDGVFADLGSTVFFDEDELPEIFEGYTITAKSLRSDRDMLTDYTHSYWMLELTHP